MENDKTIYVSFFQSGTKIRFSRGKYAMQDIDTIKIISSDDTPEETIKMANEYFDKLEETIEAFKKIENVKVYEA